MNAPFAIAHGAADHTGARDWCLPDELPGLLDRFGAIKVLSLDCFDTLLWRDCHAPTDLFALLPDCNPFQRVHGERRARQLAHAARGVHDIAIDEIYRAILPRARGGDPARSGRARARATARARLRPRSRPRRAPVMALPRRLR